MMRHPRLNCKALATVGLASLLINALSITTLATRAQANDDPNQGLPPGTVGGGSRGSVVCSAPSPLVAFMPETNELKALETSPTLWVYVPHSLSFEMAELVVYDESEVMVIDTTFSVVDQSGLMQIDLGAIAPESPLAPDQRYRWFLSLICPNNRAADISVDGWLHLTTPSPALTHQLGRAHSPIEQANLYITAGMWSEALAILVNWHESPSPEIAESAWDGVIETLSPVTIPLNLTTAYRLTGETD